MDPISSLASAAVTGGASLIGDIGSLFGQSSANAQNQANMYQQENFQEAMSNTAYQRSVADMEKAGLNPALMFGSGSSASTPSGAMATMDNPAGSLGSLGTQASSAIAAAQQAKSLDLQNQQTQSNIQKTKSEIAYNSAAADQVQATAANARASAGAINATLPYLGAKSQNDLKWLPVDQYLSRTGQVVGGVNNALGVVNKLKDLLNPLGGLVPQNMGMPAPAAPGYGPYNGPR